MRKALTIPQQAVATPGLAWALLLGEFVAVGLLVASGKLPDILFRSLQIFLRF